MAMFRVVLCGFLASIALSAQAQEQTTPDVQKCFITVKSSQKDLMIDATEIKSFNLHKMDEQAKGWRAWKNIGNYPVLSITWTKAGSKKVFFNNNNEAQQAYDNALVGLQQCKTVKVY